MPLLVRGHARYCSTRCRVAAHRARRHAGPQLPAELTDRPRWVRRSATKVPLTVDGTAASSTNPATWSPYVAAATSTAGVGLGFVLAGDGIVCVDLDHCLDPDGQPLPWVRPILGTLPDTWIEVSAGGDGLHIWGLADVAAGRRFRRGAASIEVYGTDRYIAVTGSTYRDAPIKLADLTQVIAQLL